MKVKFYWKPKCIQIGIQIVVYRRAINKRITIGYGPGVIEFRFYKDDNDYDPFMEV